MVQVKVGTSYGSLRAGATVGAVGFSDVPSGNITVAPANRGLTVAGGTPVVTVAAVANPLFVGDYSTGNFMQWPLMQNKSRNGSPSGWGNTYPATIVTDGTLPSGYAGRYEVRSGDWSGFATGERSEVSSNGEVDSGGSEGQTRWYRFQTKFDSTFPTNHASLGWGTTNQWHSNSGTGAPPIGWYVDQINGQFSLVLEKQSSPGTYISTYSILNTPLNYGNWIDIKMRIVWSTSDATGSVQAWLGGVRQTFNAAGGSGQTHNVRTIIPGDTFTYYKEGYYRQEMAPTGIVYHSGFKSGLAEADVS